MNTIRQKYKFLVLALTTVFLVGLGVAAVAFLMASRESRWSHDKNKLLSLLAFLPDCVDCTWRVQKGLGFFNPVGQTTGYISGFILLSPQQTKELESRYEWEKVASEDVIAEMSMMDLPDNTPSISPPEYYGAVYDTMQISQELLASDKQLWGVVLFAPEHNTLCFRFSQQQ